MNTYRIYFDDYTTKKFLEDGEPQHHRDYQAPNAAGALRKWMNHYYGYTADRVECIERLSPGKEAK